MKKITGCLLFLVSFMVLITGCVSGSSSSQVNSTLPVLTSTPVVQTPVIEEYLPATTAENNTGKDRFPVKFVIDSQNSVISYTVDETFLNQNNRLATAVEKPVRLPGNLK
ncbi:hypothetical protein [Anaerolinea sp.]|uniref:hypothetical protein n=1 Tax=Anaerolinea sp. TaxID=1872519 RepID=UPI002ACE07E6|nr:hypothetical protein [Anaerolinea sp.]